MKTVAADRPEAARPRLLRTPSPRPDESLMGYILRLAESNHYDSLRWILDLAGLKLPALDEGWRRLCHDQIDFTQFGQITCLSKDEIEKLRYGITGASESGREYGIAGCALPASAIRFSHPKVCPGCLRESNHCRQLWDLLAITACPDHRVVLLDRCPSCRRRVSWNRKSVGRCRCGCDWRETEIAKLEESQLRATEWLRRAMNSTGMENLSAGEGGPIRQLGFGDLCRALLCLAEFIPVGENRLRLHSTLENHLCHQALEQAAAVLEDWPANFHRFCEQMLPKTTDPDLARRLDRLAKRDGLAFLRVAMEEHLEELSRLPDPPFRFLIERRFLPVEDARRRLELGRRGFEILLSTGQLRTTSGVKNHHEVLVDEESIRHLLDRREWMLTLRGAACNLGLDEDEVRDLIRHGCLKAASGPSLDGFPDIRLEIGAIIGLYRQVERRAETSDETLITVALFDDSIGLEDLRRQLKSRRLSFGQWRRAAPDGEVTPLKLVPVGAGFSSFSLRHFAFRREEFEAYVNRRCPVVRIPPSAPAPAKREMTVSEMAGLLERRWNRQQQTFTRKGVEAYDVAQLGRVAKGIFERSDAAIY